MRYEELVLSSGGIYIVHYVGALKILDQYYPLDRFRYFTGCSAGSVVSLLYLCGYRLEELEELILGLDFTEYQELKISNFMSDFGFDVGERIQQLFQDLLKKKGVDPQITFIELFQRTNRILTMTTLNITKSKPEYHNVMTTPYLRVIDSLMMSMNIPVLFRPICRSLHYRGIYQQNHHYLDGGIVDPFPFRIIKKVPLDRKFGIYHCGKRGTDMNPNPYMNSLQSYLTHLLSILTDYHLEGKYRFLRNEMIQKNIFIIYDQENVHAINFSLSAEMKQHLMKMSGRNFENFYFSHRRKEYLAKKYFAIWRAKST